MIRKLFNFIGLAGLLIFAKIAFAQGGSVNLGSLDPFNGRDFPYIIGKISEFLLLIGAPLTGIMALYAAFQMITAGGNSEKFQGGMKTLLYAGIGFAVLLMAEGIAKVIQTIFQ